MTNSAAPRQSGFRRFLSLINLAAVSAVMLAASGCHKDSFDLDEITRPTATPDTGTPDDGPTTNSLELPDTTFEAFDRYLRDLGFEQTDLSEDADAMRAGDPDDSDEPSRATLPITGHKYTSRDGDTCVLVEMLGRAHLVIRIIGNIDDADFDFALLDENVVTPPTTASTIAGAAADTMVRAIAFNGNNPPPPILPTATYALEGEMTYNGNRFYPDGELMADFANARIGGEISLDGAEAEDDFGGTTFADGTTPITNSDNLTLGFGDVSDAANSGDILNDDLGFSGALNIITAEGFFSSLSGRPTGTYSGRFNDDTDSYVGGNEARAAPQEISGIFGGITDADNNGNELKGGFLGQCSADCRLPVIRVMPSAATIQEGGQVALMITSDADAPEGGLAVDINIGGNGVTASEFTFTATGPVTCTNLVCTVTILEDNRQVDLVLTPTSDFSTEGSEDWTATLVDLGSYDVDATSRGVDFTITDLIAAVGIMTSDTPIEGGAAVTLTITSDLLVPATLTGGLTVTVDITGADPDEIQPNADCTNFPLCIVTIPAGRDSVSLILSPLSDFSTETESWTASLVDGNDYDRAANFEVDFDITDLIAAVGIMTSDTPMEGGAAVTLTITSSETVPTTLTGGLAVTVSIRDANANEFTANAVCTNLVCIVTIPAGGNSVSLILSPLSDFSTEPGESWRAEIVNGDDYDLATDFNVVFDITDLIAAVGIMTSDTPMEGGAAVTLTITSSETVPTTLTDGLSVTIDISGANANEFTANAVCTNLVCIVTIPAGMDSVDLVLSPLSDFSTEPGESWTAEIVNGDDYDLATDFNVVFAITDLIAAVGIMTGDTARMEGGVAVTLTITSDLAAPAGGLNVTVDISGADGMDFTSAACTSTTPPRCVVRIPSGMRSVELIITPLTSDAVENIERWTAMIVPADTVFSVDSNADDVDFSITDPTFPTAMDGRTLDDLIPLDNMPDILGVDEIRDGGDENGTRAAIPITGLRYDDPNGPQIYVQKLTYANLGIWTNGQVPTVISLATATEDDFDNDFRYGFFNDNALPGSRFPGGGQATYEVEGDATYRGVNFFLEGNFVATFTGSGGSFTSNLVAGGGPTFAPDDFGSANARVPDGTNNGRLTNANDVLSLFVRGNIANDGFTGTDLQVNSTTSGFFADLETNFHAPSSRFSGRFYDSDTYDRTVSDPDEVAGTALFATPDGMDDLHFGFLGRCNFACDTPNIIGLSSTDSRAQEGGQINLVIMSDTVAPMGGFLVMFEISGAIDGEFTLPGADCSTNFPICTVTIAETTDSVNLVLSPTDDTTVETTENWMVTLMDGTNFIRDPANNAVAFDITDPLPVPIVSPDRTLADLNFYDTPDTLTAGEIRAGDEGSAGTITGLQYNDPVGLPQIYVQRLQGFAHLGIWTNQQVPTVNEFDHVFEYTFLADNAVSNSNLPTGGIAQYNFEGDATYKGVNFFPDGNLVVDFGANSYRGLMTASGSSDENHFGADDARVPDGTTDGRFLVGGTIAMSDRLRIDFAGGTIDRDGTICTNATFCGTWTLPATGVTNAPTGFFADLAGASGSVRGRFYHSSGYNPASRDPFEIAGTGEVTDSAMNELRFGFLGSCNLATTFCGPGNNQITP